MLFSYSEKVPYKKLWVGYPYSYLFILFNFRKNENNTCYFSEQNFMGSKSFLASTRYLSDGKWFYLNESWGSFLFHAMRKELTMVQLPFSMLQFKISEKEVLLTNENNPFLKISMFLKYGRICFARNNVNFNSILNLKAQMEKKILSFTF